jgi:hypothetical protein
MSLPDVKLAPLVAKTPPQKACHECPHSRKRYETAHGERLSRGEPWMRDIANRESFRVCTLTGDMPVGRTTPPAWCPLRRSETPPGVK